MRQRRCWHSSFNQYFYKTIPMPLMLFSDLARQVKSEAPNGASLFTCKLFLGDELFLAAHVGTQGNGDVDSAVGIEIVFKESN